MMWAWAIGVFSVAAVVNQSVIALFRRAQPDTPNPDLHPSRIRTAVWPRTPDSTHRQR
jgi:hypothetical protein